MAIGAPVDVPTINAQISANAAEIYHYYERIKEVYNLWNQNITTAVMNGLTISAGDQATINSFIGSLHLVVECFEGTLASAQGQDLTFSLRNVRSVI